jgi:phosphoribosylamine--glycine ligase
MSNHTRRTPQVRGNVKLVGEGDKRAVLLVGGGAREHALGAALCRSGRVSLHVFAHNPNPGLESLANGYCLGDEKDVDAIVEWARACGVDFAVIGLEDPLAVGVPDALQLAGIPTVGPLRNAARLETSKLYLRTVMRDHRIDGNLEFKYITDTEELESYLRANADRQFALKPVGLTAGKGVSVMGVQLKTVDAAIRYGKTVIQNRLGGTGILLEERVEGPEFTLQAFVDASAVRGMPLVKDYKLAYEGDVGPNTGSMGSYSQADGSLLFLTEPEHQRAQSILQAVVDAVRSTGIVYRGIIYGQFMKTRHGIKLIEINARFGDPEGINVLALLEDDFVDVCEGILNDALHTLPLRFSPRATVCKYLTPKGYPDDPQQKQPIRLDLAAIEEQGVQVFFAKVEGKNGTYTYLTSASRSIALLAIGESVEDAHERIERVLPLISGEYHMRHDIGTTALTRDAVSNWIPTSAPGVRRRVLGS